MQVITKPETRVSDVKYYVAFDGKEFSCEYDCLLHELDLNYEEAIRKIETCEKAESYPPCDGMEYADNKNYTWFRPKNTEEIDLLNKLIYHSWQKLTTKEIGRWICIETTGYSNDTWVSTIDDCMSYVRMLFSKLGYEVSITERTDDDGQTK